MEDNAKKELLAIARKSVENSVNKQPAGEFCPGSPGLQEKLGVFVTLKNSGRLRGCLGHFTSDIPLYKLVAKTAASSATEDYRFRSDPITPSEIKDLDIEISVLSSLNKIENPLDIELGVHGIYIKKGNYTGCFLPQVAVETGWNKKEFLSQCCREKAGLPSNAWKEKDVDVFVFTANIFNEKDMHIF
ncbi:MAG: AmmeMemoRadiSam system protein A [Candidatus Anammoxibacter sp.]